MLKAFLTLLLIPLLMPMAFAFAPKIHVRNRKHVPHKIQLWSHDKAAKQLREYE